MYNDFGAIKLKINNKNGKNDEKKLIGFLKRNSTKKQPTNILLAISYKKNGRSVHKSYIILGLDDSNTILFKS